jgi:hypothetical protein
LGAEGQVPHGLGVVAAVNCGAGVPTPRTASHFLGGNNSERDRIVRAVAAFMDDPKARKVEGVGPEGEAFLFGHVPLLTSADSLDSQPLPSAIRQRIANLFPPAHRLVFVVSIRQCIASF